MAHAYPEMKGFQELEQLLLTWLSFYLVTSIFKLGYIVSEGTTIGYRYGAEKKISMQVSLPGSGILTRGTLNLTPLGSQ